MRRLTPLLTLIMILAMVAPVFAGSPASVPSKTIAEGAKSYVVFMEGLPAVAYDGADAKFPATKPAAPAVATDLLKKSRRLRLSDMMIAPGQQRRLHHLL